MIDFWPLSKGAPDLGSEIDNGDPGRALTVAVSPNRGTTRVTASPPIGGQAADEQAQSARDLRARANVIESLHARYRRAITVRGHFPTEQAALKTLYLVTRGLDPKGTGQARWSVRWKPALNAFTIAFPGRIIKSTK